MNTVTGTGRVLRFDDFRGYGFVSPDDGGEDVFVHANSIDGEHKSLSPGAWVQYEAVQSERGLKALVVKVLRGGQGGRRPSTASVGTQSAEPTDEKLCDVLSERVFMSTVTEALLEATPDLAAGQLVAVRRVMLELAQRHGWVD